jgi:hypothetical protein
MEEATQTQEVSQEANEETLSSPARPDWLPEKFQTPENLVQSYSELESKIGARDESVKEDFLKELETEFYNGRPASVGEYNIPESIDEELANDNPMFQWWANEAFENGYSQEEFEAGINQFANFMDSMGPDLDAEREKLGDNAEARLNAVSAWTNKFFTEEELPAVQQLGSTAEGVAVLEKIMALQNGSSLNSLSTEPSTISQTDLDNMMKDPRYWKPGERDQGFIDKVTQGFNKLYGS